MSPRRLGAILLIVGVTLTTAPLLPFGVEHIKLPSVIKKEISESSTQAVFLYGYICVGCPIGFYLDSIKRDKSALIVVPAGMTENDLENLVRAFALHGKIMRGTEDHTVFLREVARLKYLEDWKANIVLELKNKEIVRILVR
jgi:hypothetical protein